MPQRRANTYQRSPLLMALAGSFFDYLGSKVNLAPVDLTIEGPNEGTGEGSLPAPRFEGSNPWARGRARELNTNIDAQVVGAQRLAPIQAGLAGATTKAQQAALLDAELARLDPSFVSKKVAAEDMEETPRAARKLQFKKDEDAVKLDTDREKAIIDLLVGQKLIPNDANAEAYKSLSQAILKAIGSETDKRTVDAEHSIKGTNRKEAVEDAIFGDEFLTAGNIGKLNTLKSGDSVKNFAKDATNARVLDSQKLAAQEAAIRESRFKNVGEGSLLDLETLKFLNAPTALERMNIGSSSPQTKTYTSPSTSTVPETVKPSVEEVKASTNPVFKELSDSYVSKPPPPSVAPYVRLDPSGSGKLINPDANAPILREGLMSMLPEIKGTQSVIPAAPANNPADWKFINSLQEYINLKTGERSKVRPF